VHGVDVSTLIRRLEYLPLPPQQVPIPPPPQGTPQTPNTPQTPSPNSGSLGVVSAHLKPADIFSAVNLRRHMRTGMDHILYVYPMQFDKFQYR
jgi:hypothetical protein